MQLIERYVFAVDRVNNLPYSIFCPLNWFRRRLDNSLFGVDRPPQVVTSFIHMALEEKVSLLLVAESKHGS